MDATIERDENSSSPPASATDMRTHNSTQITFLRQFKWRWSNRLVCDIIWMFKCSNRTMIGWLFYEPAPRLCLGSSSYWPTFHSLPKRKWKPKRRRSNDDRQPLDIRQTRRADRVRKRRAQWWCWLTFPTTKVKIFECVREVSFSFILHKLTHNSGSIMPCFVDRVDKLTSHERVRKKSSKGRRGNCCELSHDWLIDWSALKWRLLTQPSQHSH